MTEHYPAHYTPGEELANTITHGIGLVLALVGLPVLVLSSLSRGDALLVAGMSVFGAALVAVYASSTLYHAVKPSRTKQVLQVIDHVAIYLLIAGTYTPFALGVLRGALGWTLLGAIWTLAALGIVFKVAVRTRFPRLSTFFYVAMGWSAIVAIKPLSERMESAGFWLLVGGGLLYTIGVAFYVRPRPRYMHAVWHGFVMAGSACHFVAVWRYAG
ncbi:MAG TPA: hemolysin III family protein [Gemmatimonadaceae bacterium]|jgi:hemolysin III|nr:hemolysin III family protein [Gemmatimonadaceae bacterium]